MFSSAQQPHTASGCHIGWHQPSTSCFYSIQHSMPIVQAPMDRRATTSYDQVLLLSAPSPIIVLTLSC